MKTILASGAWLIAVLLLCLDATADEKRVFEPNETTTPTRFMIHRKQIMEDIVGESPRFPKYTTQLMNLANRNAQGTRPATVGQLSELIREFSGSDYEEWVKWYNEQHPESIENAARKVHAMVRKLEKALARIDEDMVRSWVEDLVLAKTYVGLRCQESIIKRIAQRKNQPWRLADPAEESRGIDGFIGGVPVSVKPISFKREKHLPGGIPVRIVYYEKIREGIRVTYRFE